MRAYLNLVSRTHHSDSVGENNEPSIEEIRKVHGVKDITECKCEICKRRPCTTVAVRPFETTPIPVCDKCYNDLLDEEE